MRASATRAHILRNSIRIILLLSLLSFEAPADEVFGPPPIVFSTQPQDVSVTLSETATFTISAIGALPISYQWRFNGSPIVGATNTQLVLTNVTDQNYGSYNVEATNPLGTAQSTSAFLIRPASLQVFPAVEVVMQLDPYRGYILESSSDLTAWTVLEFNLWTPEGKLSRLYQARDQKRYYRVRMIIPQPSIGAPLTAAALQNSLNTYTIQLAGEVNPYTLTFPATGEYLLTRQGQTNRGAATHFLLEGNTWTFNLTPNNPPFGVLPTSVRMEFVGPNDGSWIFFIEGQLPRVGTFGATIPRMQFIVGKALQLYYEGGAGERFDFLTETTLSYERGISTGTYDALTGAVYITLLNGWTYEIDLTNSTTATVIFRETPISTPDIQGATYILGFF